MKNEHTDRSFISKKRSAFIGFLAFLIIFFLIGIFIYQRYSTLKKEQDDEALAMANNIKARLQESLAYSLSATKTLAFFIQKDGTVKDFDSIAAQVISAGDDIDAVQIAPNGVIKYVYPLRGNISVLNYDILADPNRNKEAQKAIDKKELFFAGPFQLRQGGIGIVGRLPVFRNGKFWGFTSVVIKMPTLLKIAGIDTSAKSGYYYQLSKINPSTGIEEFFMPEHTNVPHGRSASVTVPNEGWKLTVTPITNYHDFSDLFLLLVVGLLFAGLGGIVVYNVAGRPLKLNELIKERTRQLNESEEKFSKAFHTNALGFAIYDDQRRLVEMNKSYADLLSSTTDNLLGKTSEEAGLFSKLVENKKVETKSEIERLIAANGRIHDFEMDVQLKSGSIDTLSLSIEPLELNHRKHWLISVINITEHKRAEQEIRASEIKYKELIEQASDGIFITSNDGKYIDVNTSACKMLGYTKEELLNMNGADVLYRHDDIDALPGRYDDLQTGTSHIREITLKRKDGTPLTVESNSKMLSDGRYIGIVRDLTDRKIADKAIRESEERYRALVDNATEALVVLDVNKNLFVNVSESAVMLFKYSREELLHMGPKDISPELQPDGSSSAVMAKDKMDRALNGEKICFEWTHEDKYGQLIPTEVWLVRLPSENELLIRGTIIDITARKKAAEEIKKNADLLRELYSYSQNIREEERKHIAREIHDELGQQLTGLKMDIFWINRRLKTDDNMILEKMVSTLSLIDTTIKTVRKIATELRPSILDDLGLAAALEWQGEEFEKRYEIKVKFSGSIEGEIILPNIATALFRIYQELLTNVARHAKAANVKTTIYVENNVIYLKVADDGAGFDMEGITGKKTLGLRGIQERASLIGGTSEIKSVPGNGTNVLISVPLLNGATKPKQNIQ